MFVAVGIMRARAGIIEDTKQIAGGILRGLWPNGHPKIDRAANWPAMIAKQGGGEVMTNHRSLFRVRGTVMLLAAFLLACPAYATPIWTNWSSASAGANGGGGATGSMGGVTVNYLGELDSFVINQSSTIWSPDSSFIGGSVASSPSTAGDDLRLNGSSTGSNTILFSSAVVDPIIAIWSLGSPGASASFTFLGLTPTVEAGGPNSQFGGASITALGSVVSGSEGNGVIQFAGSYSRIDFTSTFENFYAFTVGVSNTASTVPEPSSLALVAIGLAVTARRKKRSLR